MKLIQNLIANKRLWFVLVVIETLGLLYLSLFKAPTLKIGPDDQNRFAHFFAYSVYGFTCVVWRARSIKEMLQTLIYCALLGIVLEFTQRFLPHRDADLLDGICNATGALIGSMTGYLSVRKLK